MALFAESQRDAARDRLQQDWFSSVIPVADHSGDDECVGGQVGEEDESADHRDGVRLMLMLRSFLTEGSSPGLPHRFSESWAEAQAFDWI